MSPMIDIQRRHAEVYRIRLGDRDGGRPRKLTDKIRITAQSREVVEAFTEAYGGEVTAWDAQWQTYLPTSELQILVLPGQSVQQWWELWTGSVCARRCDGYQETKSGKRCMCPEDIDARVKDKAACSPTTRVNVLCPDVAVVGAGALVTHGLIAAETLPQSIAVAEGALRRGLMVPAVLRVVEHKGRNHFVVPQIEITGISINALGQSESNGALPHASGTPIAALEGRNGFTPVPQLGSTAPSIAEQSQPPAERPKRANAAAEIPASGRTRATRATEQPVAAGDVQDDPGQTPDQGVTSRSAPPPAGEPEPADTPVPAPSTTDRSPIEVMTDLIRAAGKDPDAIRAQLGYERWEDAPADVVARLTAKAQEALMDQAEAVATAPTETPAEPEPAAKKTTRSRAKKES